MHHHQFFPERIQSGDYGLCTVCEEEIALRRLETDPGATLCIACASLKEKRRACQFTGDRMSGEPQPLTSRNLCHELLPEAD